MQNPLETPRTLLLTGTAIALPLLLGGALAMLPAGAAVRLAAGIFAILFVLIALLWPDAAQTRYRWLLGGVGVSIGLLFLWPKYAYIPLDALPTKNPQRMFFLAFLAYFLFALSTSRSLRDQFVARVRGAPVLMSLIALFFAWRLLSSLASSSPLDSLYAGLIEMFEFLTPFLLVVTILRDRRDLDYLLLVLLVTATLVCLLAIAESMLKRNLFEPLIVVDTSRPEFFREALVAKLRDQQYRVKASFHHPLLLAEFLVCMLPLIFYRIGKSAIAERTLLLVLLAMILWSIYAAVSRSAIVAGLVAAIAYSGVFFVRTFARRRLDARTVFSVLAVPVFFLLAAGAYSYVLELAIGRSTAEQASSLARLVMLKYGIPQVLDSPILGHGVGFGPLILGYIGETGQVTLDNYYLSLALDSGLPALLLLSAIVGWAALRGARALGAADSDEAYLYAALSIAAIAFAMIKSILATEHNFPLFFILIGALVVLRCPVPREGSMDAATSATAPRSASA